MPSVRQSLVASVTRRYPFYSGCGTLANRDWVQRLAGTSAEVAWGKVPGGYRVRAPLDDYLGRAVFYVGENDAKITWACSRLVRPGDTVLDIGANIGLVTFALSAMVGPSGAVHAFEPLPRLHDLIDQAIARNRVTNVTLHPFALGESESRLALTVPDGHAAASSFVAERSPHGSDDVDVEVRPLSDVLAARPIGPIRLVKIDVEGFETEVLRGAERYFADHPPYAILFEFDAPGPDPRHHPVLRLLDRLGYGFLGLPRKYVRMRARRLDLRTARREEFTHDILAVRRGGDYEEAARLTRAL
ncbi:FkbM family methyltransferase [Streptomyces sp. NPDC003247]|uniref:FkbM family methyltransferase n=1 Tax=Streptomyces sp. NPDC003247 TaxID=3364677 RepID=UPI00367F16CF